MRTLLFLAAIFLAAPATLVSRVHAETLIDNITGYTINKTGKLVPFEALLFDDAGKVVLSGTRADALAQAPRAKRINGGGKTLLPGLIDAHGHILGQGVSLISLGLRDTRSLAQAQSAIRTYAAKNPTHPWVRGRGWNQVIWKLGRFPTAAELDAAVSDRPAIMRRVDGHAVWVNSKALALARIDKNTKDPQGGRIERDAEGNPSGVLVDAAMDLMNAVVPSLSDAELRQALDAALAHMRSLGLTSAHDMGLGVDMDKLFREYAAQGKLTTRVYGAISGVGDEFDALAAKGPLSSYANDLYSLRMVKLYADGALGSRGAALMEPYSDMPNSKGLLFDTADAMRAKIDKAMKAGYQVAVHAIGDAANRQILDVVETLSRVTPVAAMRHRIEHAQVAAVADIPRFAKLGVIPSMQPTHATSDMNMAEDRVGHERIKGAYAWRSFLTNGSRIACGSDFPVESANPFLGLYAAVTRESEEGTPVGGWYPNEGFSLKEAFRCFTLDAAYAAHQENVLGSLEPGKWADFILIDQDLFRMSPHHINKVKVLETWVGGKRVYARR